MGLLGVLLLALDMEGRRALPKVTRDGRLGEGEGEGEGDGEGEGEGEGDRTKKEENKNTCAHSSLDCCCCKYVFEHHHHDNNNKNNNNNKIKCNNIKLHNINKTHSQQ